MSNQVNLTDLEYSKLENYVTETLGEPKFRAKQIFGWIHGGPAKDGGIRMGAESFEDMNNLPKTLREKLAGCAALVQLAVLREQVSKLDGTRKFLFGLEDGNAIESVFMKYKFGNSICVSSQAGCRMGCRFCASTIGGLKRNLTPGEIAGQILAAQRQTGERISHVVVMGTGEPVRQLREFSGFYTHHKRQKRSRHRNAEHHGFDLWTRTEDCKVCGRFPAGKPGDIASCGKRRNAKQNHAGKQDLSDGNLT